MTIRAESSDVGSEAYIAAEHGMAVCPTGFQNLYALAMRREQAEQLGIRSINDLPFAVDWLPKVISSFSAGEWTIYGTRIASILPKN